MKLENKITITGFIGDNISNYNVKKFKEYNIEDDFNNIDNTSFLLHIPLIRKKLDGSIILNEYNQPIYDNTEFQVYIPNSILKDELVPKMRISITGELGVHIFNENSLKRKERQFIKAHSYKIL
jgi:hypothetical protein